MIGPDLDRVRGASSRRPRDRFPVTRELATIAADPSRAPGQRAALLGNLLVDTVACSLAARGAATGVDGVLAAFADDAGGAGEPPPVLVGPMTGHDPYRSALFNGAVAHALNFDAYGTARGPAGTVVVPAALAVATAETTGAELLRALEVGVEIGNRLGAAATSAPHPEPSAGAAPMTSGGIEGQILGTFAAAATAGSVLGLGVDEMHSALGLALMQAAGSAQVMIDGDVPAKGFYGGFATVVGVTAALAARAGIDARCAAVEGPAGLVARFFPGGDPRRSLDGLGRQPADDVVFKRWPCSSMVGPSIGAAVDLHASVPVAAVQSVVVTVPPAARPWCEPAAERCHPANSAAATNSVPYAVAVGLAEGDFAPWHVGPRPADRAETSELAGKVECVFVADERTVSVTLQSGITISARPPASVHLDGTEVPEKLRRIARWMGTEDAVEGVLVAANALVDLPDLRSLAEALRALAPTAEHHPRDPQPTPPVPVPRHTQGPTP